MVIRGRHIFGLDGLRAIAVVSVVLYHLSPAALPGGFLGVDVFFVLSGFLITSLLVEEHGATGRINFIGFWRRRMRRLLPALFLMLSIVALFPMVAGWVSSPLVANSIDVGSLREYATATLLYATNWFVAISGDSYFAHFSAPSPLAHTWSLAIEEQFYLLWPLVTLLMARRIRAERLAVRVSVALAATSFGAMALTYALGGPASVNFIYNATHTRLFDLAAGAALAWWLQHHDPSTLPLLRYAGRVGVTVLAILFITAGTPNGDPRSWMWYAGFPLATFATCGAIVGVIQREGGVGAVLGWSPVRYVGRISYGLYLWHWPVIVLVTTSLTHLAGKRLTVAKIVLMAALTALSYHLLEKPIREQRGPLWSRRIIAFGGAAVTVVVVFVGTTASLLPPVTFRDQLIRYAPSSPPIGGGKIVGLREAQRNFVAPTDRKVYVASFGDSIAYYGRFVLRASLSTSPHLRLNTRAIGGSTFAGDTDGRRSSLDLLSERHYDVALVSTSWDDELALKDPKRFEREYRELIDLFRAKGVQVVAFVGVPLRHTAGFTSMTPAQIAADGRRLRRGHDAWRREVITVVKSSQGRAVFFPIDTAFDPRGRYEAHLAPPRHPDAPPATWNRVRMVDGTHMCPPGLVMWAAAISYDVITLTGVPTTPREWWLGKWIDKPDPLAMDVRSLCPMDHPRG